MKREHLPELDQIAAELVDEKTVSVGFYFDVGVYNVFIISDDLNFIELSMNHRSTLARSCGFFFNVGLLRGQYFRY
jgi:hypothetical protein